MEKRWEIKETEDIITQNLAKELGVKNVIAHLLVLRGVRTFNEAKEFFRPKLSDLHDPFLMKDMSKAITRIEIAIKTKQKILVYGDYDVDGTTSVAMLYSFIKKYYKNVDYYVPCRYEEGYGISLKGVNYASQNNISLVIALDCGINAIEEINYAKQKNIDFIICDHHVPSERIPDACAILNPKQADCRYPYKDLSGCGVGFKLIQGYCLKNQISFNQLAPYLDLLVLSIGADLVPMHGENRTLAFYGLQQLNLEPRAGLKALIDLAQKTKELTMSDLTFGLAPRINAAGRIKHAKQAVKILIEEDSYKARLFADEIELNNNTRKELEKKITDEASHMLLENKKSTVVFSEKWHKGIVGIVASRLIEKCYRPTIVFAEENGVLTGSARSVHDFNIYEAISKCSYLCENFGGHKYAAGLTIKKEKINDFINAFERVVSEKITTDQLTPKIKADFELNINDIDEKLFRIIKQFAPFGVSNPSPLFISKGVVKSGSARNIGGDGLHIKFSVKSKHRTLPTIGFGMGSLFQKINDCTSLDICYSINENEWNGRKNLQLILSAIKPSNELC